MKKLFKPLIPLVIVGLALVACNSEAAPTLGQPGRPTLTFIYTDN